MTQLTRTILDEARQAYNDEIKEQWKIQISHESYVRDKKREHLALFLERIGYLEQAVIDDGPQVLTEPTPVRVEAMIGDDLILRVEGASHDYYIRCFVRVNGVLRSWKPVYNTSRQHFLLDLGERLSQEMWEPMPDPNWEEEDA